MTGVGASGSAAPLCGKASDVRKNQNNSRKVAKARRNAKAEFLHCFATLAYFATLRETALPVRGLIHTFFAFPSSELPAHLFPCGPGERLFAFL